MADDDGAARQQRSPVLRVARPPRNRYTPSPTEHSETRSLLLSKIESSYAEAHLRLAAGARRTSNRRRPVPATLLAAAGVSIGLLDPVSNIIINTISSSSSSPVAPPSSAAAAIDDDENSSKLAAEMAGRSLQGLIAFLTYFFPYLEDWEAVRYLHLADGDLLCAARTVVADRGMLLRFSIASAAAAPAASAALALAADVANHPDPTHLLRVWTLLSSSGHRLHQAVSLLSGSPPPPDELDSDELDRRLKAMLGDSVISPTNNLTITIPWDLAASRPPYAGAIAAEMPYEHTRSLQLVLLDTIHGFYLQALAVLPRGELRAHLHRSLLKAGHCYGPTDPVSNIVRNTLWHHANFPGAKTVTPVLDVIGPDSLTRLETRCFYGLVSFLQTRYHCLSEHQAVRCLVAASGQLSVADPKLLMSAAANAADAVHHHQQQQQCRSSSAADTDSDSGGHLCHCMWSHYDDVVREVERQSPCGGVQEAYMAAATAAWHPNPAEQAAFLASWKGDPPEVMVKMNRSHQQQQQLSSEDVQRWSQLMSPEQPPILERVRRYGDYDVRDGKLRSLYQQRRVSKLVKDALSNHLLQDGKPVYDLHIISCVNENVGPDYCDDTKVFPLSYNFSPYHYLYAHVNFLATRKEDSLSGASYPILFFAEFNNEKKDLPPLVCCPVNEPMPFAEHVRCLYCEAQGARVVHPASMEFHGGGVEFEEVIRGEHSLSDGWLTCKSDYAVQRMREVEEDLMYIEVDGID